MPEGVVAPARAAWRVCCAYRHKGATAPPARVVAWIRSANEPIVIHRTCTRCGCAYEWGVHVAAFAPPLGFSEEEISATVNGGAEPPWTEREAVLVALVDELHDAATISDSLWKGLEANWSPVQLVELITLVGQYLAVSFVANGLRVELEDGAERFPTAK